MENRIETSLKKERAVETKHLSLMPMESMEKVKGVFVLGVQCKSAYMYSN